METTANFCCVEIGTMNASTSYPILQKRKVLANNFQKVFPAFTYKFFVHAHVMFDWSTFVELELNLGINFKNVLLQMQRCSWFGTFQTQAKTIVLLKYANKCAHFYFTFN